MDMNLSKLQDMVRDREAWRAAVHAVTKSQIQLSDWTTNLFPGILYSRVSSLSGIPSAWGKYQVLSTCASHLSLVSLFHRMGFECTSALWLLMPFCSESSAITSVMYTVITPILRPLIYSLKYEDIHRAPKRLCAVASIKAPPVVVLKKFPSFQSVKNLNWNLIFWLKWSETQSLDH